MLVSAIRAAVECQLLLCEHRNCHPAKITATRANETVFGSVNANRRHYEMAAAALQHADKAWLDRLITRREPVEQWTLSLERRPDDIKVIIDFS